MCFEKSLLVVAYVVEICWCCDDKLLIYVNFILYLVGWDMHQWCILCTFYTITVVPLKVQIFYEIFKIYELSYAGCEFDRASSLIHGNKRPIKCNRLVFYRKTYCLLNMFQAQLCPSSGALELYRWLLPVVLGSWVYRSLVWCGAVGYVSGLRDTDSCVVASLRMSRAISPLSRALS
jgi:hypothetical protein